MNDPVLDAVVVGAGHSGLAISYLLKKSGRNHHVLERGRIGESWLNQRWDTFKLNTANKLNLLPGETVPSTDPDGFSTAQKFADKLRAYADAFSLPVQENCLVTAIERDPSSHLFTIRYFENKEEKKRRSKSVVIASGGQSEKKIPPFSRFISPDIFQYHAADYRNAAQLPDGAVLVVGSAQSGVQIAEDLLEAGRKVFLCTSNVGRVPRRYRGKDVVDWLIECGFYVLKTSEADLQTIQSKVPQVSGVGPQGRTVSLQSLAKRGAVILGKMDHAHGDTITLQPNAAAHILFGDQFSAKVKTMIDGLIERMQLPAAPPETDESDLPDESATCASPLSVLDIKQHLINSIIWTTGFGADLSYLKLPVMHAGGTPIHQEGISDIGGLFFLGFPWLRMRQSGIILGVKDDAEFIFQRMEEFLS